MADATKNLPVSWESGSHSWGVVKDGIPTIREGALVTRETAGGTYDHGGDDADVRFAGVALEEGAPGQKLRLRTIGVFGPYAYVPGDATAALIGAEVALIDDQSVDLPAATANAVRCGTVFAVEGAGRVRVRIEGYARG